MKGSGKALGLIATIAVSLLQCELSAACGEPSAKHPPKLTVSGDNILAVSQGIVGGSEAEPNSYPWMIYIGHCGGALIGNKWVLSAAHCFADDNGVVDSKFTGGKYSVRVGTHNRNWGRDAKMKNVIVHSSYRGPCKGTAGDIALVELQDEIDFTDTIQPICLPSSSDDYHEHGNMVVAGWGRLAYQGGPPSPSNLQHVVVQSQQDLCLKHSASIFNTEKEMCANAKGKDSCKGDSGGPLFGIQGGKYTIMGVVSCAKRGCAQEAYPGIYTHVPSYRQWIKDNTGL